MVGMGQVCGMGTMRRYHILENWRKKAPPGGEAHKQRLRPCEVNYQEDE